MNSDTRSNSPPRTNGWSCPWHPLQVFSLLFIFLLALSHYGFLVYYFPGYWRIIGYIVPGIILLISLVCIIITTTIDPADTHLKHNMTMGIFKRGHFNPNEHAHVISEEYHCRLCNTDVTSRAKHCRICDKCVEGFDHHCKWLNTCVGSKNYRWFIATITSSLFGSLSAVLISTVFFVLYFSSRDNIRYYCNNSFNISSCDDDTVRMFAVSVPAVLFPIVTGILIILNSIATILIGHLTIFHCYLIIKGISTYDYITMQRQDTTTTTRACCLKKNINRVSPTAEVDNISLTDSAGMITFNRTPPGSDNEDETHNTQLQNTIESLPLPNHTNQDIDITNNVQSSSQQSLEEVPSNHSLSNHSTTNNESVLILPIEHPPSPVSPSPVFPLTDAPFIPPSPIPTSPIPTSPIPTSPIRTSPICTSPVLSTHVPPSPIPPSPVPPSPIPTSQWSLSDTTSQATIRKVTFNEIDKDKSVHPYLPPSPHMSSSLSRRPLPPLISDDPCHHWSYESLTSVNSSQSCISLSHDVRYHRRSLTKLPPLYPIETIGLKRNELKQQLPHNLTPLVKSNRQ